MEFTSTAPNLRPPRGLPTQKRPNDKMTARIDSRREGAADLLRGHSSRAAQGSTSLKLGTSMGADPLNDVARQPKSCAVVDHVRAHDDRDLGTGPDGGRILQGTPGYTHIPCRGGENLAETVIIGERATVERWGR
jgi:hypothetical protein